MTDKTTKPPLRVIDGGPKKAVGKPASGPAKRGGGVGGVGGNGGPHEPTKESRTIAMLCAAMGYTHDQTAAVMKIARSTLEKHYAAELKDGGIVINARIAGNLASIASSSTHPRAVTAAIFWLKNKAGFRDAPADDGDDDQDDVRWTVEIGDKNAGKTG